MKKNYTKDYQVAYPFNLNGKQLTYTTDQHKLYYTWKEGEEVNLAFEINPKFRAAPIQLVVYNNKYEPIYSIIDYPDLNCNIYLNIDQSLSQSIFKAGFYYCELGASLKYGDTVQKFILIPANGCILQVTTLAEVQ